MRPLAFEPGACSRLGGHIWEDGPVGTLRAGMGDNQTAVAIENYPADSRVKLSENGIVQTLPGRMGTGGNSVPLVMDKSQVALADTGYTVKTLKIRSGCEGGGKGALIQEDKSATLSTSNDQTVFVPKTAAFIGGQGAKAGGIGYSEAVAPTIRSAGGNCVPMVMAAYGICSYHSYAMMSQNPHSGVYETQTARTLDASPPNPNCNQGGMAVVAVQGSMIGRKPENGPRGSGVGDGICFSLTETDRHAVCYQDKVGALCACDYKFPQNSQIEGGKAVVERVAVEDCKYEANLRYIVRRLTPTECARLQGFPSWWCAGLETPEPTEEDISFWTEVWETHRKITGTSSRPKSRSQIVKWLKAPHSDSAEYKMWGNGVSLPVVVFVLGGIAYYGGK